MAAGSSASSVWRTYSKRRVRCGRTASVQYLFRHLGLVVQLMLTHVLLVATALLIALVIAAPIAILITRKRQWQPSVLGFFGIIYTIPSLALFALLIPFEGLGFWTAVTALAAYA